MRALALLLLLAFPFMATAQTQWITLKTPYQYETEYIIHDIATDLFKMAYYARHKQLPNETNMRVKATELNPMEYGYRKFNIAIFPDLNSAPVDAEEEFNEAIWAPEAYDNFTRDLFGTFRLTASAASEKGNSKLAETLTAFTAEVVEQQNNAVSLQLEKDFLNPALHEDAALVIGTFLLRDASGEFFEIRATLNRMTAHLAFARQLRAGQAPGENGMLAEAVLYTLIGNETDALARVAKLNEASPGVSSWARALKVRNTFDYRLFANAKAKNNLEQTQYFRAMCRSLGTTVAWQRISSEKLAPLPDWYRITKTETFSVGLGHYLADGMMAAEMREIADVHRLHFQSDLPDAELVAKLNIEPEHCVSAASNGSARVRVIGWGHWAHFEQRHLCHALKSQFFFMFRDWGVRGEAVSFRREFESKFSQLRLYPFLRLYVATDEADYKRGVDETLEAVSTYPHLSPCRTWNHLGHIPPTWPRYTPKLYAINEWHRHNPPPNTVYDAGPRFHHRTLTERDDSKSIMERLHKSAPYDRTVTNGILDYFLKTPSYNECAAMMKPVLEYDVFQVMKLSNIAPDSKTAIDLLTGIATDFPQAHFDLYERFFPIDKAKAAEHLELGIRHGGDDVQASNNALWLMLYHYRNGDKAKAAEMADLGASVYSYLGLLAKAVHSELEGNLPEAIQYHQLIEKRYGGTDTLVGLYARRVRAGDNTYQARLDPIVKGVFPNGIQKLSDIPSVAPRAGARLERENRWMKQNRISTTDVIVALNGFLVENAEQYSFIRDAELSDELVLVVWRPAQKKYVTLNCSVPLGRFGVGLVDYVPQN